MRLLGASPRSWQEIEGIATQILRECCPERLVVPGRVNVLKIAQEYLPRAHGVLFAVGDTPPGIEAYVLFDTPLAPPRLVLSPKTYTSLLEEGSRARFTTAHEIGHAVMHLADYRRLGNVLTRRMRLEPYRSAERQADVFASRLLMPTQAFLLALQAHGPDPKRLALVFGTSLSATRIRLRELG